MEYYAVLTVSTAVIVALAALFWIKTRSVSFPLGIAFMYYWSLYGGWSIVIDRLGGESGKTYGYLEEKLFPIHLDDNYFWTLVLYATFIVLIEAVLLASVTSIKTPGRESWVPIRISHPPLLIMASLSGVASYVLIKGDIEAAESLNMSAYVVIRGGLGEVSIYFTIHQILNRVALLAAALGFAVLCSGKNPQLLVGRRCWWSGIGYLAILIGMFWFAFMLGNKNELFFSGIAGSLFYLANAGSPRIVPLSIMSLAGFTAVLFGDMARGLPLSELAQAITSLGIAELTELVQMAPSSNEGFAAHFSMYGALAHKVPFTYGSSFVSLATSVVPRLLWLDRPEDIYSYYAMNVGAVHGQGYTIHHATAWYLNFGLIGVLLGAVLWGWVWAQCFKSYINVTSKDARVYTIWAALAPWMFVACIPMLIRTGPEGYKAVMVEAFLIPTLLLIIASFRWQAFMPSLVRPRRSNSPCVSSEEPA